jgi:hypothetical protein
MQKIKGRSVTPQQADIYALLKRFGSKGLTDHALVAAAQHELPKAYSDSGIRTRRSELADAGLVRVTGSVRTRSGRQASRWAAV